MLKHWINRGSVLIWYAALIPILIASTGLAIDTGRMYLHESELENAARALAIKGISVETSYTPHLLDDRRQDPSFTVNLNDTTYTFRKLSSNDAAGIEKKDSYDAEVEEYMTKEHLAYEKDTELWKDEDKDAYCYFVTLNDSIFATFMRYLGYDELSVSTTAVAVAAPMASGGAIDSAVLESIASEVGEKAANYTWEGVAGNETNPNNPIQYFVTDQNGNQIKHYSVGQEKPAYYVTAYAKYKNTFTHKESCTSKIIAYKDHPSWTQTVADNYSSDYLGDSRPIGKYTNDEINAMNDIVDAKLNELDSSPSGPNYCADAILLSEPVELNGKFQAQLDKLYQLVWTFDGSFANKVNPANSEAIDHDFVTFFVDRPTKEHDWTVRGSILDISAEGNPYLGFSNQTAPMYIRIESEPHANNYKQVTFVQPITIRVRDHVQKPLIIAYEGPAQNRLWQDAPYIDTISPWGLYSYGEGPAYNFRNQRAWKSSNEYYGLSSETLLTSVRTSPPITLNLDSDAVFNGILYAPFSVVVITGSGKINGLIMAQDVRGNVNISGRTRITNQEVTFPVLERLGRKNNTNYRLYDKTIYLTYVYDTFIDHTAYGSGT